MPTYEYECQACNHKFEKFQSMLANNLRKCPKCKKFKLQRLIGSGSGIIFKGSGFYETDYKRAANPENKEQKNKEKSTDSSSQETGKSESGKSKADSSNKTVAKTKKD